MIGPARTPSCVNCGCRISDDGPEQTEAWLASMCPACHEGSELQDWDDECVEDAASCDCSWHENLRAAKASRCAVLELPEMIEYMDVLLWARPVLARGLTLSVVSWEGRVVAGSILFPGREEPLTAREIQAFTRRAA